MHKEEVKYLLLSQIKNEQSPIKLLMTVANLSMKKQGYPFSDRVVLYDQEYKFFCQIDNILDPDGESRFEMSFKDSNEEVVNEDDYEIISNGMVYPMFSQEFIELNGRYIRFYVKNFSLFSIDYKFSLYESNEYDLVRYNILTGEFENFLVAGKRVEQWEKKSRASLPGYVCYVPEPTMRKQIMDFLQKNNRDTALADTLLASLHTDVSYIKSETSRMAEIFRLLCELSPAYRATL